MIPPRERWRDTSARGPPRSSPWALDRRAEIDGLSRLAAAEGGDHAGGVVLEPAHDQDRLRQHLRLGGGEIARALLVRHVGDPAQTAARLLIIERVHRRSRPSCLVWKRAGNSPL